MRIFVYFSVSPFLFPSLFFHSPFSLSLSLSLSVFFFFSLSLLLHFFLPCFIYFLLPCFLLLFLVLFVCLCFMKRTTSNIKLESPGEKRHININLLLWLTSRWPCDKRLVVPGLTRPKSLCVRLET